MGKAVRCLADTRVEAEVRWKGSVIFEEVLTL